ncbi:MAG TPA: alpha/beta hydrolase [Pseudomonadales bacterium]
MTALVLLPGMDGTGKMFADFVDAMQARCIVVAYPLDQPLGYAELEQLVHALLPQDEDFILLGESFSGPLALTLAAQHLPRLRAVVLVSTFAKLPYPRLPQFLQRLISAGPFWRMPPRLTARTILGRHCTPRLFELLKQTRASVAPQVWKARIRAVLGIDCTPVLPYVHVPVLHLRGREDQLIFTSAVTHLSRNLPTMQLVSLDGPHWLLQTKPAEAAAALRAFATRHSIVL